MKRLKLEPAEALVILSLIFLASTLGLSFYYNHKIAKQNDEFNAKIGLMANEMSGSINQLKKDFFSLKENLTAEINLVNSNLKNFKVQNRDEINTLNLLIEQIENQSQIKLGELKDELKSIQVKSSDFSAIAGEVIRSVVSVGTDKGQGSGAAIMDNGFIATNYHVVSGAKIIRISTYEGEVYNAELIGYEPVYDIAVLKVNANLKSLKLGNSDKVKVGQKVIALGNPAGLSFTVTEGIISAVHREGPNGFNIYLQTDVPINPGNSGGPLVNVNSEIIGLNNFKIGGFESLGFAIESNAVEQVVDEIIGAYMQQVSQQ